MGVAIKFSYLTVVVLHDCAFFVRANMRSALVLIVSLTVVITLLDARVSVDLKTIGFSEMPNELTSQLRRIPPSILLNQFSALRKRKNNNWYLRFRHNQKRRIEDSDKNLDV